MAGLLSDELNKQMDADLFGEPKKSSLDPKLSDEMDKDLGLSPSRSWASAIKPAEPEEPGYLGALGKGVYAGFRRRLPEMTGQAIQFTGIVPETGKAIAEFGTAGEERPQFKSPLKQVLYEGGEMLAPSVAIPAALGAAGVGAIPASIATAGLFGLSQAQATKEEAEKRGVEPGAAPYATGTIEALGEAAGTYYLTRLLGPLAPLFKPGVKTTAKEVINPTLGRLIKEFPKTFAVEAGTEFGQQAGQAAVEKYSGIRPEAEPLREGLGVIGPTAVLTGLTMGMGHPMSRIRGRHLEKLLTDPKIDLEAREAAVNAVSSYMEDADKDISLRWKQKALETVKQGQAVPLEEDIYEWIGLKPKQAIPAEPKAGEGGKIPAAGSGTLGTPGTGAIPDQPGGYDLITKKPAEPEASPVPPEEAIPTGGKERPASRADWQEVEKAAPSSATAIPLEEGGWKDLLTSLQTVSGKGQPATPKAPAYPEDQVRAALSGEEPAEAAIPEKESLSEKPSATLEKVKRETPRGYFPADELWDKKVGEVQDEWSDLVADYEDVKAKTEKEIEPLRKELESLKGKRDKFSNVRKREIEKEIGQKEEIYKSIPAQAERGHLNETQKFAGMVEEEARKKGIPEDRLPDFVADFQIISSGERPYIENNYNLSHREVFDELAQEYLAPEEGEEPPKAAIPAIEKPEAPKGAIPSAPQKTPPGHFTEKMKNARNAGEGRSIIAEYEKAFASIEKEAGLPNTVGPGGSGYAGRGYSTLNQKEKQAAVKKVSQANPELGERLRTLIQDIDDSRKNWDNLLVNENRDRIQKGDAREEERLEEVRTLNENTEMLIREGGYERSKRQPRSPEGEAALLKRGYVPMLWSPETGRLEKNILGEWVRKKGEEEKLEAAIPGAAEPQPKQAIPTPEKIEEAAADAASSPENKLPEPTQAQKEAGNYQKGHVNLHGLDISIENPRGSERSGVSPEGKPWKTTMKSHYGYIKGTKGKDKDHLDVFIGPYPDSEFVTVIDQVDPETGKFDEHKVMMGFLDMASGQVGYLANYEPGWKGLGAAKGLDILEFKDWLKKGDTTKPIALKGAIPAAERRKDLEKRKRISEMSPEEMRKELLTDPLTGLGNRRAYDESPRLSFQAMIDADSLKAVNDIMGHEAGDELLKAIGQALGRHATRAFHTSGDEFIVEGNTKADIEEQLQKALNILNKAEIEATAPDGTIFKYKGLEISYGIGSTLKEADDAMAANKRERERRGLRAPRGERPKGLAEVPAAGVEAEGEAPERAIAEELSQSNLSKIVGEFKKRYATAPLGDDVVEEAAKRTHAKFKNQYFPENIPTRKGDHANDAFFSRLHDEVYEKWLKAAHGVEPKESQAAIPAAKEPEAPEKDLYANKDTYKGISIYARPQDLTDEEFEKILAPSSTPMEERNEQLARYMDDRRFLVLVKKGEIGWQPSLPEFRQPLQTDFYAIREYIRSGKLPERGEKVEKISSRLLELDPKFTQGGAAKTANGILSAIERGTYYDALHPGNPNARRVFHELTGRKLPPGVGKTQDFFQGNPFEADFSKIGKAGREIRTAPPTLARRLSTPERKDLKYSEFKKVSDDFYIIVQGREAEKVADAKSAEIPGFENFDFFSRQLETGTFVITEGITGTFMASEDSLQKAIDKTRDALKQRGPKFVEEAIVKTALNYGITPRYRVEKEGTKEETKAAEPETKEAKPDTEPPKPGTPAATEAKPVAGKPSRHFIINPQTGKMEMYFSKEEHRALSDDHREKVRKYFLWSPTKKAWISKANKDLFWPRKIAKEIGIEELKKEEPAPAKETPPKIDMIESPDLEYQRFIEGLSEEQKQKAKSFIVTNPRSPLAQIRAIKKELDITDRSANEERTRQEFNEGDTVYFKEGWNKEAQTITEINKNGDVLIGSSRAYSPGEFTKELPGGEGKPGAVPAQTEEEITPRDIPFEAVKYANAIKNKLKKNFAWSYLKWKTGKTEEKPESRGLSGMAAQIVRMSIDKMLGEPYKFKPIVGEAKAEGGEGHETGRRPRSSERPLVVRPPGMAPGEQPAAREEPLREGSGEAGRAPEPGDEEGALGLHELEAPGQGRGRLRDRDRNLPAAAGEPAGAPAGGARREDKEVGGELRRHPGRVEDRNHVIEAGDTLVPGGKISRLKANVAAIELARSLEKEKRNPSPQEKKILAQFTGWGALGKEAFNPEQWVHHDEDKNGTLKSQYAWNYYTEDEKKEYKAWFDRIGKKLHPDLGGLLTQEEWDEAKSSILNAFYTSREVIENGLWPIIDRLGFKGGTILEPAGGVGHILGLMPQNLAENSRIQAVEKDRMSGLILSKLYPESKVFVKGFEQAREIRDNSVDLVVSNFPFGETRIFDAKHKDYSGFSIHNYFFARSVDALKPGGILVAITSHYTMDSAGTDHRKYLASKADFVGGLRLPGTAFDKTAGTEVTTDILIFRKKDASSFRGEPFLGTQPIELKEKDDKGNPKNAYVNEYFGSRPDMVLGKHSLQGTMYGGKDEYTLLPIPGKELKDLMPAPIATLPGEIAGETSLQVEAAPIFADEGTKDGLMVEKDGKFYINEGGHLEPIIGAQKNEMVRKYINVRSALKNLITMEIGEEAGEKEIEAQRRKLNQLYDNFVAKHGFISGNDKKWIRQDAEYSLMSSLEADDKEKTKATGKKIFKKAAILTQRTNFPFKEPETAASEEDAVKISLTYRNRIDLPYVARLLNAEKDAVRDSLVKKKIAYLNPATGNLESPDEYLSGNVREKLEKAQEAAKDDPAFDINVEELKKVQPPELAINQIYYRLGSPWIPTDAIKDFMGDLLNFRDAEVKYLETSETSKFIVSVDASASWRLRENATINNVWGVEGANALSLIEDALNLRFSAIYDHEYDAETQKEKPVFNPQKSQAAREMQRKLQEEFVKWAKNHEKWSGELANIYNRDFNNTKLKEFAVPEMDFYPNASHSIRLRKHQKRAVSRNLQESCVDAHAVGTGKTYIFATTAMEMRRLGTAKKPMIVVQNSTVHQYAKAFRELYPTANILIPNKKQLSKENRKRLISQIVTGNWDAIIVPHSAFDMISVTPEKEAAYIREQLGELERVIKELEDEGEDKRTIRQVEKMKEAKEQKLYKLLGGKKEDIIYFDEIGVDALLMDEAHRYKRGEFYTKMTKIKGIDRQSASRSMLMLLKAQEVSKRTGGKNVILATGTPISNTLAEIWTMLRYVRPDLLERFNAKHFDSFAANYGQVVQDTEETPSGDFKAIERFAKYVNGPEILAMWRSAADIVLPEDVEVKRPAIKSGKAIDLQLSRPEELANFIKWIKAERDAWDSLPGKEKMQSRHVPLVLFGLAKKAAIDLRLVHPTMPDLPGSKANRSVDEIFKRWKETKETRMTQVVFSDTFQSTDKSFNLFKDVRDKLVAKGVPKSEIAIIHDFNSDDKRDELFEKVNDGDIRVVMGTTEKLGVGVNIQERLYAAHHIDVPLRPMDFEQRNGRIWRPGNLNDEIEILVYGVKNTLDSTGFQRLLIKQKFINQMMRGDITDRSFDDPFDPTQATFQDMMSAFGNPKVREKFGLENQIRDLNSLKESHEKEIGRARGEINGNKYKLQGFREDLKHWDELSKILRDAFPDNKVTDFAFEVKGKMVKMDKDHFLQAIQDEIDEATKEAQEIIGKGEFDIDREAYEAERQVEKLSRRYVNFRGELNGVPFWFTLRPRTMSGIDGKKRTLIFDGVGIQYSLHPKEYEDWHYYLERNVSTPGGILISVPSLVPYGIGRPREIREDITKAENNIKNLAPLLNQPFDREAELAEKKVRLAAVEKELMAAESETGEDAAKAKEKKAAELDSLRHEFGGLSKGIYAEKKKVEETPAAEEKKTPEAPEVEGEDLEGEKGDPSFQLDHPRVPPFYSALRRTIEQKMGASMPVPQLRVLLNQPGIKQEEVKWSGIDDFLAGKERKVTKQDVLDFLEQNRIQVREVLKGEKTRELSWEKKRDGSYSADDERGAVWEAIPNGSKSGWELFRDGNPYGVFETPARAMMRAEEDADFGPAKFERFTVPGGKNYRELLFSLPSRGFVKGTDGDVRRFHDISHALWTHLSAVQRNELRSEYRRITGGKERAGFRSSHWNEPNVLAHVRFNERTATTTKKVGEHGRIDTEERVLFIEEIQSDWHQEGRKKGYNQPDLTELPEGYKVTEKGTGVSGIDRHGNPFTGKKYTVFAPDGHIVASSEQSRELALIAALRELSVGRRTGVPLAPFAKTWHEFVLKRMVRWAAENGFDRIAWTTGAQQGDRYNLARAVNRIEWSKTDPFTGEEKPDIALSIEPKEVEAEELYGEIRRRTGLHWDTDPEAGPLLYVPADRLDEVVGKDLARRILEDPADSGAIEGEGLKIGGEGMKGFYDKIIPDFLNKFGKKWGAKVEETEVPKEISVDEAGTEYPASPEEKLAVHSLPITESMKESALTEGFPMFMPERSSWSDKTARVVPHSTIEKLKSHPDYEAAKAGDRAAGLRLARDLMKSEKIAELKKALAKEKQVIIIAPVRMREKGLDNAIPPLMAEVISDQTGWKVDTGIIQINDVAHTEKDAIDRLFAQAEFEGDVNPGATYVILDDVVTTGGTLANLKGFIESKGGRVKAIQTIGAAQFATNLKIMPATLKNLRETYGHSLKEVLDFVYGGPIHEENLTESEARTFIRNKREILERRRKARDEGQGRQGFSLGQRRAPQRTLPAKELTSPGERKIEDAGEPKAGIRPEELSGIAALVEKIAHSRVFFPENIPIDLKDPKNQAGLKKHGYTDEEIALFISEGYTAHPVSGRMTPVLVSPTQWQAIINVAVQGKTGRQVKSTALHEAFEAVRDFMLTPEEKKILDQRIPGKDRKSASEIQADAFADYAQEKKGPLLPKSLQTLFDRIEAFFERLGNFLQGLGYRSAEDIFEEAAAGEIRERYVRQPARFAPEGGTGSGEIAGILDEAGIPHGEPKGRGYVSIPLLSSQGEKIGGINVARVGDEYVISGINRAASREEAEGIPTRAVRAIVDRAMAEGSTVRASAAEIASPFWEKMGFTREGQDFVMRTEGKRAAAFKLEGPIRKILNTLKSPDFPIRAAQDKGFKDSIRKNRLGLVKVTDNDMKLWERVLSLPFWLHDKYPELKPMIHTQMKREESRAETIHGLLNRARPFFDLKGEEMAMAEKALVQGDREGKVYHEKELREKFQLSSEGVKGYRAVRNTLDWIHKEWKGKIEESLLKEYEKAKWFVLFKAAHGLEFTGEETLSLDKVLKKTHKEMEKPVDTVRAHLQRVFEEEFSHRNKRLLADLLGDYMRAYRRARKQIDKVKAIVREAIGEGMSEEELNKNTQELVQAYIRSLPAIKQLKEMRAELRKLGGYFPRSRKMGKYRVVVVDKFTDSLGNEEKTTVFYQNAANRLEATRLYDKIKADPEYKDMKVLVEANRQEPETTFMGASAINMQRLIDNAIDKVKAQGTVEPEIAGLIRLNVLETLADELKARGAGRFSIKRSEGVIEGYQKTNLKEVLKDYIDGWSGMITKQEAALEFLEELKGVPRNKPELMRYASKYAQDMLRNQEPLDRVSAKMRSLAFLYFLGGSLRAALVNFTQNYVSAIPFLAREVGAKSLKAEKLYHKAMFDAATGMNVSPAEKQMLDEMINKGVAEDQFIRQINREVKGAVGQVTGKVVDILAKPFSWMERLNRKSAALAMFRVKYTSYSSNGSYSSEEAYRKAFDNAQDFVYKTHYLMTKANLPSVAAGGDVGSQFLKTAYTFRRFTHNYLLSLHHSMKGEDGKLALDVMARSLAYVALLAGIPAIPFLDDLLDEWEKFFGTPVRSNMRKTLREAGGPVLEKLGMAGVPALMGIDISGSLKTGFPLLGSGTPQDTIYGVYGGLTRKGMNAMTAVEREDYLRALEFASPGFIEAVLKAYRMSETGVTTPRGKIVTDEQGKPIRLGAGEGIAQAAGFRPERLARISGEHWTMENSQAYFKGKRDDLYSRYRLARTPEEKQRAIRDMQRFNMEARKYRGVIPPITATSMGQATEQKPEKSFLGFGRMMEGGP